MHRPIKDGCRGLAKAGAADVADHSDHSQPIAADPQLLNLATDRILVSKEHPSERGRKHDGIGRLIRRQSSESAATQQRDLHGVKIAAIDQAPARLNRLTRGENRRTNREDIVAGVAVGEGQIADEADARDLGQRGDAHGNAFVERDGILVPCRPHRDSQHMFRGKARMHLRQTPETADQHGGANQQGEGQSQLGDDHRVTQARTRSRTRRPALERFLRAGLRSGERRTDSGQASHEQRDAAGGREDPGVDGYLGRARQSHRPQKGDSPVRQEHAEKATRHRDREALGDEWADHAPASSAQRGADRQFLGAGRGANQQQI